MHIVIKPGQIESVYVNHTTVVHIPSQSPVTITTSDTAYERILGEITILGTLLADKQDTMDVRKKLALIQAQLEQLLKHPPVTVTYKKSGWCFARIT